jgi:cytochrome b561
MHFALYFLMIAMPLGGWLLLSAAGKPIPFFGLELPALVGASKSLATLIKEIHEVGGTVGYFLIGFHTAAALFHHYVLRDKHATADASEPGLSRPRSPASWSSPSL